MAPVSQGSQSSNMSPVAKRRLPSCDITSDSTSKEHKRRKFDEGERFGFESFSCPGGNFKWKTQELCPKVINQTDVFSMENVEEFLDPGKYGDMKKDIGKFGDYGSVTKNIELLLARWKRFERCNSLNFMTSQRHLEKGKYSQDDNLESNTTAILEIIDLEDVNEPPNGKYSQDDNLESNTTAILEIIDLEDVNEPPEKGTTVQSAKAEENGSAEVISSRPTIIIDLEAEEKNLCPPKVIDLIEPAVYVPEKNLEIQSAQLETNKGPPEDLRFAEQQQKIEGYCHASENEVDKNQGAVDAYQDTYMDDQVTPPNTEDAEMEEGVSKSDSIHGGLGNIWDEMSFALEYSKDTFIDSTLDAHADEVEDCDHSFILKDDIGSVCRVCGLIEKGIDTMIEYHFGKIKRSGKTYQYERSYGNCTDHTSIIPDGCEHDISLSEIVVHPRHRKMMKNHQFEGFNFLLSNLMTDNPGGCVLAHAPGSGKTFMIISFLQSFMAKYPYARPLIVLPRGILSTWRKEFQKWQVEDMPLYDFYSSKAEGRIQQLEVLTKWRNERSILFLGYKQFTTIVCDLDSSRTTVACQSILLTCPSILILDEGHTPRNKDTDILNSLEKVQTPRKVVLSGTLYQNHVKEVFNVVNLVRPKFLKTEPARTIKRRILSKVDISSSRSSLKNYPDDMFYDIMERTILDDEKFNRKVNIIQDLREMTSKVLHYYKGDSLDELPGLVDFTVFLGLSTRQKREVEELMKFTKSRFKLQSELSAISVHPQLRTVSKNCGGNGKVDTEKIDSILENLKEIGVKAEFYLNLLQLCESTGEKLLVFGQYLAPLKFLERLAMKVKNYTVGREIFVITGDSDSDIRDSSMEQFNTSGDARVFFGSIKACGEGIALVGASRIIILDVHLNPSVTRQAIGRAFRPGQERKVYTYRLVASGSPEEEDHLTCFRKECIPKMWFEWNACQGQQGFEMEKVDVNHCGDVFLQNRLLNADVVSVCKR